MKNAIKLGFGLVIGQELAKFVLRVVNQLIIDKAANGEGSTTEK